MDRAARLSAVRAAVTDVGCDALIVTKRVNVRWLTGFTGSSGVVVVGPDAVTVITDGRYEAQLDRQLQAADVDATVVIEREIEEPVTTALADAARIALESEDVTWSRQRMFARWLGEDRLVPTEGLIEGLRRIKDAGELARLRTAATIADAALASVRPELGRRPTERQVATALERAMVDGGADGPSFPTIVAAGPNSALPHATPTDRTIDRGDLVVIDLGAAVDGYGSDMTRTFVVGPPSPSQGELLAAVAEAQAAGVAAIRAGADVAGIDATCRQALGRRGLAEAFVHGTGHGIGLEIHEEPILSGRATGVLGRSEVVTVEPGAYLDGVGGVRLEDSVVVTGDGCEPITSSPKDPVVEADR